jgi:hypothetical protein
MSFTIERSQSPPRNGLSQIFSKSRREKKGKDSTNTSIKSSGSDSLGVRTSLEEAADKLKAHSTEDDGDSNGLMKLVPKGIGAKRRRKQQEREEEQRISEEAARGRSVADRGTLENEDKSFIHSSGDGSSLITDDSETES